MTKSSKLHQAMLTVCAGRTLMSLDQRSETHAPMATIKEELSAMKLVLMATRTMDQEEPSASSAKKTIDSSEVSAGKAGNPTSQKIDITDMLTSNTAARELSDRELFATRNHLNVTHLSLESLGSVALGMSHITVEPCALKMQQLARVRFKHKLIQFLT